MSSPQVRSAVMSVLNGTFPTLFIRDLSSYSSIDDLPSNSTGVVLLVQFNGGDEGMINIAGEGNQGWEERGSIALHYLIPTGFDFTPSLSQMEAIRLSLRGMRLQDSVVIESAVPFTDQISNALSLDGGWQGWVSYVSYTRYVCG